MKLIYNSGRERCEIIEKQDFEESIFAEQYVRALSLIKQFVSNTDSDSGSDTLKIVAFCGDRGAGKSSCMRTVINMLQDSNAEHINIFLKKNGFSSIINTPFEILDVIDPSFFDTCHNVLELVLGTMYGKAINLNKSRTDFDFTCINSLMKDFQKAKSCVHTLHNTSDGSFDELQELDSLSAGVELRTHINSLISKYLRLTGRKWLVIPIDDIDFNMENAYTMCEQIRQYLSSPQCIVLIGVKMEQLQNAVSINIRNKTNEKTWTKQNYLTDNDITEMAKKFLTKLIPVSYRINMPQLYSLSERNLQLIVSPLSDNKSLPLKDAIVNLIFNRTRYLFYNSKGGISPVIPNNLRDLISLVGLLVSMPEVNDSHSDNEQLKMNKRLFKSYFFNTWIGRLSAETALKIDSLVKYGVGNSLNKNVVSILKETFKEILKRDFSNEGTDLSGNKKTPSQSLIENIINDGNFSYNISVGDVFYLFRLIEMEHLNDSDADLIFILKSLYSIKLYEEYENITEQDGMVYPKEDDMDVSEDDAKANTENDGGNGGIYRIDERFLHTNSLQRLLCGAYFTYCPGDLLPKNSDGKYFDMTVIYGKEFNDLLRNLSKEIKEKDETEDKNGSPAFDETFYKRLWLAEFFILTTVRSVSSKYVSNIDNVSYNHRANYIPFYLTQYNNSTGFYVFDILAPFYNMANIKFAYGRFSDIAPGLYEFALKDKSSLLGQILSKCEESREGMNYGFPPEMHRLLSDAIIRNSEVLSAVFENAELNRIKNHDAAGIGSISSFYKNIMKSKMSTHPFNVYNEEYNDRYFISFQYLKPFIEFIEGIKESEKAKNDNGQGDTDEIKNLFNKIFYLKENIPSVEEIINGIGRGTSTNTIYRNMRNRIPYFKNWNDEMLGEVILIKEGNYTKPEIREAVEKWYEEKQSQK